MFIVKKLFATVMSRFHPGMAVHPHDCNSQAHFDQLVENGFIEDDTPPAEQDTSFEFTVGGPAEHGEHPQAHPAAQPDPHQAATSVLEAANPAPGTVPHPDAPPPAAMPPAGAPPPAAPAPAAPQPAPPPAAPPPAAPAQPATASPAPVAPAQPVAPPPAAAPHPAT